MIEDNSLNIKLNNLSALLKELLVHYHLFLIGGNLFVVDLETQETFSIDDFLEKYKIKLRKLKILHLLSKDTDEE